MEPLIAPATDSNWLGKYRLIADLGHGGMADVYLGLSGGTPNPQRPTPRIVVLKRLRNMEDEHATAMFLDEARIAIRLDHPNVVRTFDVAWEDEAFFIIMEFLHGPTLQQLRRRAQTHGGMPLRFELYMLSQTLRGLQYAHELLDVHGAPLRIVHRDFTPHNIIVTHDGVPKILDFGIAKAADSAVQTAAGLYKGKLSYMPPEQLIGKGVDQRADLFAAGAMLFQAITGKPLWEGMESSVIIRRLAMGEVPTLRNVRPIVAPELIDLCRRALAPRPEQRVGTATEMRRMIDAYCRFAGFNVGREEMADYVHSLFGSQRVQQESLIAEQLKHAQDLPLASDADGVVGLPRMPAMERHGTGQTSLPPRGLRVVAPEPELLRAPELPDDPHDAITDSRRMPDIDIELTGDYPPPAGPSRWRLWAVGGAALAAVALLGFFVGRDFVETHPLSHGRSAVTVHHRAP